MKRTISAMVGKGSVNHNQRKFTAENVDKSRSYLNKIYYSDKIEDVYHQLFDEALKRYNETASSYGPSQTALSHVHSCY